MQIMRNSMAILVAMGLAAGGAVTAQSVPGVGGFFAESYGQQRQCAEPVEQCRRHGGAAASVECNFRL
jgi:hypothetical protein